MATKKLDRVLDTSGRRNPSWTWADKHFLNPRMVETFKAWAKTKDNADKYPTLNLWLTSDDGTTTAPVRVSAYQCSTPLVTVDLCRMAEWEGINGLSEYSDFDISGFSWEDIAAAHYYSLDLPVIGLGANHPVRRWAKAVSMSERMLEPLIYFTIRHQESLAERGQGYAVYWPDSQLVHNSGTDFYEALLVMGSSLTKCELWTVETAVSDFHSGRLIVVRAHDPSAAESSPVK